MPKGTKDGAATVQKTRNSFQLIDVCQEIKPLQGSSCYAFAITVGQSIFAGTRNSAHVSDEPITALHWKLDGLSGTQFCLTSRAFANYQLGERARIYSSET